MASSSVSLSRRRTLRLRVTGCVQKLHRLNAVGYWGRLFTFVAHDAEHNGDRHILFATITHCCRAYFGHQLSFLVLLLT